MVDSSATVPKSTVMRITSQRPRAPRGVRRWDL